MDQIIKDINTLVNQLLTIYKQEFQGIQSPFKFLQILPGFDLFLEASHKISNKMLDNNYKDFIYKLYQEFWEYYKETQEIYSCLSKYWQIILDSLVDLETQKKQSLIFYFNNFLEYIKQQNLLLSNPNIYNAIIDSKGIKLLFGFKNLLHDLVNNNGYLNITTTELTAFKLGDNLATTPGKIVFQNDLIELIQYSINKSAVYKVPILFIPPCINKYYILDLSTKNSLVRWLVEQGFMVYMISWVNPTNNLNKQFEDYIIEGCLEAINVITSKINHKIHAVGYCIGGTLLGSLSAYMAKIKDDRIISITNYMSPLDFSDLGDLNIFINETALDFVEKLIDKKGYFDGRLLSMVFSALRPKELFWPYFINNYLLAESLQPFDVLYWNSDPTNLPKDMYKFYLRNICFNNLLKDPNQIIINNIAIDLNLVNIPIFSVAGLRDHITPWKAIYNSLKLYGNHDKSQFLLSSSGHVKGLINPPLDHKYSYRVNIINKNLPDKPELWFNNSIEYQGAWWYYWKDWLTNINSDKITISVANKIRSKNYLRDAPGQYVLAKC